MICHDILGVFQAFTPKFVEKYANLGAEMQKAYEEYIAEVRQGSFPAPEHTYNMLEGELDKFNQLRSK